MWLAQQAEMPRKTPPRPGETMRRDSRHAADLELLGRRVASRPATLTEETLLGALGHTIPADLVTELRRVTGSIVHRRWPQIEAATTTGGAS